MLSESSNMNRASNILRLAVRCLYSSMRWVRDRGKQAIPALAACQAVTSPSETPFRDSRP